MKSVPNARIPGAPSALAALLTLMAACAPGAGGGPVEGPGPAAAPPPYIPLTTGLPAIPEVDAPLRIDVVHPVQGQARPRVDSTFVYGNVGTGGAALFINGTPVPVAPNGAFIAYLPLPESGAWELTATRGGQRDKATVSYRTAGPQPVVEEETPAPAAPRTNTVPEGTFAAPRSARVTGGGDTLATGGDAIYARPTPTGPYRWFFPRGARLRLLERRGTQYRAQLGDTVTAWINAAAVTLADTAAAGADAAPLGAVSVRPAARWVDVRVPARFAPFQLTADGQRWALTVYDVSAAGAAAPGAGDALLRGVSVEAAGARTARVAMDFARAPWGYKAFYEPDGTLVVRVRRPPQIDPAAPLRGIRVLIDPGHPPAGATGPTRLREAEANLAISTRLIQRLRAAGADVRTTRTGTESVELGARTEQAVREDAELLISVHNNAFGEGANPARAHGTSVYYFHPFSAELARALDREIVGVTRLPDLGAKWGNLALVRPTWMPSALTESLFMPIPEQEAALRDPDFLDRLADAHLRGIEAFLRARAGM
ncbi:MAG TPA: N-acetylmuramoyl-L-alanine amidase [Longimicrobium sp.]|nr:N-acetylmuramoyl-L-alanine amidase [Longimicrobium sp.]